MRSELEARRARALAAAGRLTAAAVLVYGTDGRGANLSYLANFAPIFGDAFLLLTRTKAVYILAFDWEIPRARMASGIEEFIPTFNPLDALVGVLQREGLVGGRVAGVGLDRLPHNLHACLFDRAPQLEVVDATAAIERARRIKSPYEIDHLRRAVAVTESALVVVRKALQPGVSELEMAAVMDLEMKRGGAAETAFPTCVISGPDRVVPVDLPTERVIRQGDSVMVDAGAAHAGYRADLTRTYVVGEPNAEQRRAWEVVHDAYRRVVDAIRPGVACRRLQEIAQGSVESRGYRLAHRIGHGVGLHTSLEWPNLASDEDALEPGMALAIEPGVCVAGVGTIKIEDDVIVLDDGCEVLSQSSRALT